MEGELDCRSWNFIDPFPALELKDILPFSARARSWLARASKESTFPQPRFVQIAGGAFMLGGLDYHHGNFLDRVNHLAPFYERLEARLRHLMEHRPGEPPPFPMATDAERAIFDTLDHEAFAYLNRLGQFHTFAKASSVEHLIPRASELMLFRHKHTAHRSIDAPKAEDDPRLQEAHALAFGFGRLSVGSFPVFQIYDHQRFVQFHMRDDHPVIMRQALDALQAIHPVPK
jgi:hypothetical protein